MFQLSGQELEEAVSTLQELLRIDTTNPPGNERPAAERVAEALRQEGIEPILVESAPGRASVVGRLRGDGRARPLMLSSHLDVVPAEARRWRHPPFSGVQAEGCVWGRGALDMKGMTAMGLSVLRLLKRRGIRLGRDVILAAVADEEAGCDEGSKFLVEQHPELIDAEFVLNEVGGFSLELAGRRFYPVQVAEKGIAWLKVTLRGEPGHGSLPRPDSCVVDLGRALQALGTRRLGFHPPEETATFLRKVAAQVRLPERAVLPALLRPALAGFILGHLIRDAGLRSSLHASLYNTANPTIIRAGEKINVVPSEASIEVDGRSLPGQTASDVASEVRRLLGPECNVEIVKQADPTVFSADTPLFAAIEEVMRLRDPGGVVVPYMVPGFTDAKSYHRLGATCYGFYPMLLPAGLRFAQMFHGDDERIPVSALRFGIETLYELVVRFCGGEG
jgi:acetylornithine deacetylase/succinyl-diaminopimelate desuccinylase-like protein